MTTRITPILVLLLLLAGAAAVAPAAALKVDGARIALDVTPGQTAKSPIGISIGADEKEGDFAVEVLGFGQSEDGTYSGLAASADTGTFSARPFITIDKPTVHLKPGERASVTASFAVPATAKDGGRYAIILVHPAAASSGAPAAFATAVAIPVLLTIKGGTIDEKGAIAAVDTARPEIGRPFTVTATVQNTGNYHYYGIVANATVTDSTGKAAAAVKTTPMTRAIIPGNSVKSVAQVTPGLPEGRYLLTVRMETQDGDVLATATRELTVGNPAAAGGPALAGTPATPAPGITYSPGPGPVAACMAVAAGLVAGIYRRQRRE